MTKNIPRFCLDPNGRPPVQLFSLWVKNASVQLGRVSCFTCLMHQNKYRSRRAAGYKLHSSHSQCGSDILSVEELPLPETRILYVRSMTPFWRLHFDMIFIRLQEVISVI